MFGPVNAAVGSLALPQRDFAIFAEQTDVSSFFSVTYEAHQGPNVTTGFEKPTPRVTAVSRASARVS